MWKFKDKTTKNSVRASSLYFYFILSLLFLFSYPFIAIYLCHHFKNLSVNWRDILCRLLITYYK